MLKSGNLLHSLDAMLNLYVLLHFTRSPVLMREWYFMVDERHSLKQTESQSNEENQRKWSESEKENVIKMNIVQIDVNSPYSVLNHLQRM